MREVGTVLWLVGSIMMGSLIAQLFIHNQPVFGVFAIAVAVLLMLGDAMKVDGR